MHITVFCSVLFVFFSFFSFADLAHYIYLSDSMQALEEVEKNIATMKTMLSGDGETEPSADQITQLTVEICNDDVISLLFHKLPILGWEVSNNLIIYRQM